MPPKKTEEVPPKSSDGKRLSVSNQPAAATETDLLGLGGPLAYDIKNDKFVKFVLDQFSTAEVDPCSSVPPLLIKSLRLPDVATDFYNSLFVDFLFEDFHFCADMKFQEERTKSFLSLMNRLRSFAMAGDMKGAQALLSDSLADSAMRCIEAKKTQKKAVERAPTPTDPPPGEAVESTAKKDTKAASKKPPEPKKAAKMPVAAVEEVVAPIQAPPPPPLAPSWFDVADIPSIVEYIQTGVLQHSALYAATGMRPKQSDPKGPPTRYFALVETVGPAPRLAMARTEEVHLKFLEQVKEEEANKLKRLQERESLEIQEEAASAEKAKKEEEERRLNEEHKSMQEAALSNKAVEEAVKTVTAELDQREAARRKGLLERLEKIEAALAGM